MVWRLRNELADVSGMGLFRRRAALVGVIASILLVFVGLLATVALTTNDSKGAEAGVTTLPPDAPRRDLPKVLDGTVFDSARVGDHIVVTGDFTTVRRSDNSVASTGGVFAYHIDTGELLETLLPTIGRASGRASVLAVEPAGPDSVFLGGKFGTVNGVTQRRITKMTVSTGEIDTGFVADIDGPVRDIVLGNGRLFVGGEFETINGEDRGRLAELDPNTGTVQPDFDHPITGSTRVAGTPFGPKHLAVTADNLLVVAHRARFVGTEERRGIAVIDLADNNILPWRTMLWGTGESAIHTVDAEVSPDGSYIVVVGDGGDDPRLGRDAAIAFPLTDVSNSQVTPLWTARNFDSTYAVGISEDAVFIGGHFCWVESDVAPDPWPGDGDFTNNNSCFGVTPASRFAPAVVNRDQMAALDPATGHALNWDPGSDGLEGVQSIEVIDRGLLVGHDGTFFGRDGQDRRAWNVGRHGFFDVTQPGGQTSLLFIDQPVLGTCNGLEPTITGTTRNDELEGTDGRDVILAGPGADVVFGFGGDDVICGGTGNDVIRGGDGDDLLFGNEAADTLFGEAGDDDLRGGYWKDHLLGGIGNDTLRGGRGTDRLQGGPGDDTVLGGDGMDTVEGNAGQDTTNGQQGRDQVAGGPGSDLVLGGQGRDRCSGAGLGAADHAGDRVQGCERR